MDSFSDIGDWTFEEKQKVEQFLQNIAVDSENICIVGSMSLSVRGLRQHNDIDIAVNSANRKKLQNTSKPPDVSVCVGRYEPLGLSDDDIIHTEVYHDIIDGIKIIRPEITLAYKQYRNRPKDRDHIDLLESYRDNAADWDETIYQRNRTSQSRSMLSRGITSLRNDGVAVTGIKTIGFLTRQYPILSDLQKKIPTKLLKLISQKFSGSLKEVTPPFLLNQQYQNGTFTSMDTVVCYDAIQIIKQGGSIEPPFNETIETVLTDSERETLRSVCQGETQRNVSVRVTPSYRIRNPVDTAALLATRESTLPLTVSIRRTESRSPEWLQNQGVSKDEIERLENSKQKLFERHGLYFYAILWPPSREYHDTIESMLASTTSIEVVSKTNLELSNMESFVHRVYGAQGDPTSTEHINNKIKKMAPFGDDIRVIVFELDNPQIRDGISLTMEMIKNDIRNDLLSEFSEDLYYCILHVTDNYEDNKRTRDVLESEGYSID